jgi:hypothetical protein
LRRLGAARYDTAIVCGLAGGLRRGVPSGTVVVASEVRRIDGTTLPTDRTLSALLADRARALGFEPLIAPLLCAPHLVVSRERENWAERGCAAVDMESGVVAARRLAVVRVILDTPERELSPQWLQPLRACIQPWLWPQMIWLARTAPGYAARAARVAAAAV